MYEAVNTLSLRWNDKHFQSVYKYYMYMDLIISVFGILEYRSADEALAARIGLQNADFYATKARVRSNVAMLEELNEDVRKI